MVRSTQTTNGRDEKSDGQIAIVGSCRVNGSRPTAARWLGSSLAPAFGYIGIRAIVGSGAEYWPADV